MHHHEPALALVIADVRRDRGWSQRRLGVELGVDHATVSRWEAGRALPSPALRHRIEAMIGAPGGASVRGDEIRDLRVRAGLAQAEFARRFGLAQSTLSRIEGGTLRPSPELLKTLRLISPRSDALEALRDASLADCERSYEAYWRTCAVFDHPDGAAWGAALTQRLLELQPSERGAPRLLARTYASRAYWALARGRHRDVERMARPAIQFGIEHGFDLTSGYALWAWARSRFNKVRINDADRAIVNGLVTIARRHTRRELPYADLVEAAHERMVRRVDDAEDRLRALADRVFRSDEGGQFGGLTPDHRWATVQSYRAMFRLSVGDDEDVLDLAESVSHHDPVTTLIFGAYANAAMARLGQRDETRERDLAAHAEALGHGYAYATVLQHTQTLAGRRAGNPNEA